jgi:hypothetical protein
MNLDLLLNKYNHKLKILYKRLSDLLIRKNIVIIAGNYNHRKKIVLNLNNKIIYENI